MLSIKKPLVLGLWIAALSACDHQPPTSHLAADGNDIQNNSTWDTTFADDPQTFSQHASLMLSGATGSFSTDDGSQGTLSGIVYNYITPEPELKLGVYGKWEMNGESGSFTFRIAGDGESFVGQWSSGPTRRGTWTGTRTHQ